MCVPKLFLSHKIIRMFGPKTAIFVPKYAFFGTYRPCQLVWCPVGWLVGGCGARAVSRRIPIYFIMYNVLKYVIYCNYYYNILINYIQGVPIITSTVDHLVWAGARHDNDNRTRKCFEPCDSKDSLPSFKSVTERLATG